MATADTDANRLADQYEALVRGNHDNPFAILGVHHSGKQRTVRAFLPQAQRVAVVDTTGDVLADMQRVHDGGVFTAIMPPGKRRYRLRVTTHAGYTSDIEDCYFFPPTLGQLDLYLLGEGSDKQIHNKLGAQTRPY